MPRVVSVKPATHERSEISIEALLTIHFLPVHRPWSLESSALPALRRCPISNKRYAYTPQGLKTSASNAGKAVADRGRDERDAGSGVLIPTEGRPWRL